MKRLPLLILSFVLAAATTGWSGESRVEQELAAGKEYITSGNYGEAVVVLKKAVSEAPDDPEANFYLGMALNRLGDKGAESHLKKSLMQRPDDPATNYEMGLLYYQKNNYAEAADYIENIEQLAPGSDYAEKARQLLRQMEETAKGKRWDLSFLTGMQYDSNVIVNGLTSPLPQGYSRQADWRAVISASGHYSFYRSDSLDLKAGYSLYQSLHTKLDSFNVTRNLFDVSASYTISPNIKLDAYYNFEYLFVGGVVYDLAHNVGPSLVIKSGDWGTTSIDYRFNNTNFRNSNQFNNNSDRTGDNHMAGLLHIIPLGRSAAVWASYAYDRNLTRTSIWDYAGNRFLVGVRSALPFKLVGDLSGEYYYRSYGASGSGITRYDKQYSMLASLTRNITDNVSVVLNEYFTRSNSTVKIFDYERSITGLFVNVRFP